MAAPAIRHRRNSFQRVDCDDRGCRRSPCRSGFPAVENTSSLPAGFIEPTGETDMVAYWIGRVRVTDPEGYGKYAKLAGPAIEKHGGKFLARSGRLVTLEGDEYPRNVVVEFPSIEAAEACYTPMPRARQTACSVLSKGFRAGCGTTRKGGARCAALPVSGRKAGRRLSNPRIRNRRCRSRRSTGSWKRC